MQFLHTGAIKSTNLVEANGSFLEGTLDVLDIIEASHFYFDWHRSRIHADLQGMHADLQKTHTDLQGIHAGLQETYAAYRGLMLFTEDACWFT